MSLSRKGVTTCTSRGCETYGAMQAAPRTGGSDKRHRDDRTVMRGQASQPQSPRMWPCWSIRQVLRKSHDESEASLGTSACLAAAGPGKGRPCSGPVAAPSWACWDLALSREILVPHGGCCRRPMQAAEAYSFAIWPWQAHKKLFMWKFLAQVRGAN